MPYAILRFEKRKGGPAAALEKHHERKKEQYSSNPDVDKSRSKFNFHLITPKQKYHAEIQSRIERAGCRTRKDSIRFIDTIVTASPEFLDELPLAHKRKYFERTLIFLAKEVGARNIFSAVVHMDERNPHMHVCFVPLTKDGRLSAKEVIGNRQKLVEWQDKFHDFMSEAFPALERGESASATGRKHVPTWLYKQANRLSAQMADIQKEVADIGVLNAGKQKEKVMQMLFEWYPSVNAFENKLKPYARQIKELEQDRAYLKNQNDRREVSLRQVNGQLVDLQYQIADYEDFLKSIPDDLRKELMERYEHSLEQENAQPTQGWILQ